MNQSYKLFFKFLVSFAFYFTYSLIKSDVFTLGREDFSQIKESVDESKKKLMGSFSEQILAFPKNDDSYQRKILGESGLYEIWHEKKIQSWAQSQGFSITENSPLGGIQFIYGVVFKPPGLFFELGIEAYEVATKYSLGWILNLDMGFFREDQNKDTLSTNFKYYDNLIRYEIFINKIHFKTVEIGYGRTATSPISFCIPFIRSRGGKILVEIKIANHPDNFGILYDAFLTKETR